MPPRENLIKWIKNQSLPTKTRRVFFCLKVSCVLLPLYTTTFKPTFPFYHPAREVLTQAKKSNITELKEIPENLSTGDEDDSDQWLTEEEQLSEDLNEEDSDEESVKTEEEQEDPIDEEEQGETIEELGAGREEKEEDDVVTAISNAALAPERKKPHDLRSPSMVTDLSFHPTEELIAICNIEGEIFWYNMI